MILIGWFSYALCKNLCFGSRNKIVLSLHNQQFTICFFSWISCTVYIFLLFSPFGRKKKIKDAKSSVKKNRPRKISRTITWYETKGITGFKFLQSIRMCVYVTCAYILYIHSHKSALIAKKDKTKTTPFSYEVLCWHRSWIRLSHCGYICRHRKLIK